MYFYLWGKSREILKNVYVKRTVSGYKLDAKGLMSTTNVACEAGLLTITPPLQTWRMTVENSQTFGLTASDIPKSPGPTVNSCDFIVGPVIC